MTLSIGIDPGKRMGAAVVATEPGGGYARLSIALRSDQMKQLRDFLGEYSTATAWIEEPDSHVMAGRIGLRQTAHGIQQSVSHRTSVHTIFSLGVVSGKVAGLCEELGITYHFISAGDVKELVTGNRTASKAEMALYLRSMGYVFPNMPRSSKSDPEQVDALAIALAGAKRMEEVGSADR